jgi:hypothetical protein
LFSFQKELIPGGGLQFLLDNGGHAHHPPQEFNPNLRKIQQRRNVADGGCGSWSLESGDVPRRAITATSTRKTLERRV